MSTTYPAKIILFGEYTVLKGSRALAIPFRQLFGEWQFNAADDQQDLFAFADYLALHFSSQLNIPFFREELAKGLFFQSNIPTGYGLGSSGALCAGIFDRYAFDTAKELPANELKVLFAKMENFFHSASSGTDPLICYLQKSICLHPDGQNSMVDLPPLSSPYSFFLLNSQHPRQTGPLVKQFSIDYKENAFFRQQIDAQLMPANEAAIEANLQGDSEKVWKSFDQISRLQFDLLPHLILPAIRPIWGEGLAGDDFRLKICGAGGGGFYLGMTKELNILNQNFLFLF